ncbi:MAG: hypothetical protein ACE5KM_14345 [Planctomycetaceae bacterium]
MRIRCTGCRAVLKAPDSAAGKVIKCPKCETRLRIPEADPQPAADYEVDDYGDFSDEEFGDGFSDLGDYGSPTGGRKKPCPACAEPISANATQCKYCGEQLRAPRRRKRKKKRRRARTYAASDDESLTAGDWVLAVICSGIGCIMGIVYLVQGNSKGWKMIAISFASAVVKNIVFLAARGVPR